MRKIKPSDDAIAIAAATLASTLFDLRKDDLQNSDFASQEKYLVNYYRWAVDQISQEKEQ